MEDNKGSHVNHEEEAGSQEMISIMHCLSSRQAEELTRHASAGARMETKRMDKQKLVLSGNR